MVCRHWVRTGRCDFGETCRFIHGSPRGLGHVHDGMGQGLVEASECAKETKVTDDSSADEDEDEDEDDDLEIVGFLHQEEDDGEFRD